MSRLSATALGYWWARPLPGRLMSGPWRSQLREGPGTNEKPGAEKRAGSDFRANRAALTLSKLQLFEKATIPLIYKGLLLHSRFHKIAALGIRD
jgi:hypothetical protein